jgi:hypothetical protein
LPLPHSPAAKKATATVVKIIISQLTKYLAENRPTKIANTKIINKPLITLTWKESTSQNVIIGKSSAASSAKYTNLIRVVLVKSF